MKKTLFFSIFLLSINLVAAATIYGTIYDLGLEKVNNVKVEINTEPNQLYISKNGSYAFNVPNGNYTIEASYFQDGILESYAEEGVSVKDDGTYVFDLILFPSVEEDLVEDIEIDDIFEENPNYFYQFIIGALILMFIIVYFYIKYYLKGSEEGTKNGGDKGTTDSNDLDKIVEIIKKEGGRITQKEIRKQIPLSEGKISLMITELEDKGVLKRIKKGRGNVIILNK